MRFQTDKVGLGYLPTYLRIASEIGIAGRVCEVGVYRGGSLEMWQALFPDGIVVGVDIDHTSTWPDGTYIVVSSQTDKQLPVQLTHISPQFDLIVEDASHEGSASRITWELLWPMVAPGGWYVLEDWQVGFRDWNGPGPQRPSMFDTAVSFLQQLSTSDGDVAEITYRYGQVILRKRGDHA